MRAAAPNTHDEGGTAHDRAAPGPAHWNHRLPRERHRRHGSADSRAGARPRQSTPHDATTTTGRRSRRCRAAARPSVAAPRGRDERGEHHEPAPEELAEARGIRCPISEGESEDRDDHAEQHGDAEATQEDQPRVRAGRRLRPPLARCDARGREAHQHAPRGLGAERMVDRRAESRAARRSSRTTMCSRASRPCSAGSCRATSACSRSTSRMRRWPGWRRGHRMRPRDRSRRPA